MAAYRSIKTRDPFWDDTPGPRLVIGDDKCTPSRRRNERAETGMIPDRDIWRAVNLLIREHGDEAEIVAARRADEMLERGDHEGQIVWLRIRRAIVELQVAPVGKPN
jgi:hypothetical protein